MWIAKGFEGYIVGERKAERIIAIATICFNQLFWEEVLALTRAFAFN